MSSAEMFVEQKGKGEIGYEPVLSNSIINESRERNYL